MMTICAFESGMMTLTELLDEADKKLKELVAIQKQMEALKCQL